MLYLYYKSGGEKMKKKEKVNLWFSENKAKDGKFFFVPIRKGKKIVKCTALTTAKEPPDDGSVFLSAVYLPGTDPEPIRSKRRVATAA